MASTCSHPPFVCQTECHNHGAPTPAAQQPCADGLTRREDGTCANPASPSRQQSVSAARPVQQTYRCLGWRQTEACDPNGRRDHRSDLQCDATVPSGASGFCECEGAADGSRLRVRLTSCDHMPFTCAVECARSEHYTCDGWRQTSECTADGPREEAQDLPCETKVLAGVSGYCECGGGSRRVPRPPGCSRDEVADSCGAVCSRGESLYEMLGLHDGAAEGAVKQAFRRISLKLHPDKQRTAATKEAAATRFTEVRAAYDVLSDPDARILYDMHGFDSAKDKASKQREHSSELQVSATLEEVYTGAKKSLTITRRVVCKGCSARHGGMEKVRCRRCGDCPPEVRNVNVQLAPGFVVQQQQEVASEVRLARLNAGHRHRQLSVACLHCACALLPQERCEQQQYVLEYEVRRGMSDGEVISFARAGEQRPGRIPGDVSLKVQVAQHTNVSLDVNGTVRTNTRVRRKGRDLHAEVRVSLKEALLGFRTTLTHVDGHTVSIERRNTVTAPGTMLRIPGEGLVKVDADGVVEAEATGALVLTVQVDFPSQLSEDAAAWAQSALPAR